MAGRRRKRQSEDVLEIETEEVDFVLEPSQVEACSGYAVAVVYDENENPVVDIKTYGRVNFAHIRRDIERAFPNAQIRQLNRTGSVTVVKKSKTKSVSNKK